MSGGFCPDDWHGTTEADLQQMSWGEDYEYWSDVAATTAKYAAVRWTDYATHDAAIEAARREGLVFHELTAAEQCARLDAVEAAAKDTSHDQ